MEASVFELAYQSAVKHHKEAVLAVFNDLSARIQAAEFDALHHASVRAVELRFSSLQLAGRIWAGSLPYAKAEESLLRQFPEYPPEVCRKALGDALAEAR